jgi:hypothetical protein
MYLRDGNAGPAVPRLPETDGSRVEGNDFVLFKRIAENNEILGTVYLKSDYKWQARLANYLGIFGAITALSLVVALLVSAWLQTTLTRPVLATAAVAREVVERRDFSLRAVADDGRRDGVAWLTRSTTCWPRSAGGRRSWRLEPALSSARWPERRQGDTRTRS